MTTSFTSFHSCLLLISPFCLTFQYLCKGILVERDFDIRKAAGGQSFRPVQKNYTVQVTANYLEIHLFWNGKGTCCVPFQGTYGPSISALSVIPCNIISFFC